MIHGQSTIVEVLSTALSKSTALSVQPVLELIAGLATDLQQEFYPSFATFVAIITGQTLRAQDASIVKWAFKCMSHLLMILWRPISSSGDRLNKTYTSLAVLFEFKQPDYVRYLGAETVAFLVRKAKDKRELLVHVLDSMSTMTTDPVAVAKLLFESIRTVNQQFNSHRDGLTALFLDMLPHAYDDILVQLNQFCCDHSNQEHFKPILDATVEALKKHLQDSKKDPTVFLRCIKTVIVCKEGRLVNNVASVIQIINTILEHNIHTDNVIEIVTAAVEAYKLSKTDDDMKALIGFIFNPAFSHEQITSFVDHFLDAPIFESFVLRPYLAWIQAELAGQFDVLSHHLATTLARRNPSCRVGSQLEQVERLALDLNLVPALR